MNRKILFRGKRLDNGEWVYGWCCVACFGKYPFEPCIIPADEADGGNLEHIRVDPATVGQYTGLTDKNGKRIFEGDIVRTFDTDGDKWIGQVLIDQGSWCVMDHRNYTLLYDLVLRGVEVIGNIFDNPELLEEVNHE